MPLKEKEGFDAIAVKFDPGTKAAILAFAEANNLKTVSAVVRLAVANLIGGKQAINSLAYNEGVRRGYSETKTAISEALKSLWVR